MAKTLSVSKRYVRMPFLYWWDVGESRKTAIRRDGQLVLVQRDTRLKARIAAADLLPHLTEDRRSSRGVCIGGKGNWGLYVRPDRPSSIEVVGKPPVFIKVDWR